MTLPVALAATLLSSLLFGFAFPPHPARALAFVCLVPLLLALRSGSAARALGLAWLWAVASAWAIAPFFASSLAGYYERPLWVGVLAGMLIFSVMASLYYMAFALIYRALPRLHPLLTPLLVAAAWTSVELARGRLFTGSSFLIGNPWGLLGYTHASGSLAQVASWTGVYGISFAIVAVNAGVAGWIEALRERAPSARMAGWGALVAALPAVAFALGGALALRAARGASENDGLREVAVAQGNVALERRWRPEYNQTTFDTYAALSRRALAEGKPLTLVWPETALTFSLELESNYRDEIAKALRSGDAELIAGAPGDMGASRPVFNSVFLISPQGEIRARYDKQYLVPFSEYYPFGSDDLVRRRAEGLQVFSPGKPDPALLDTRLGRAGVLICNEAMLPEVAAARARAGAEILVNPSNDSWIDADPAFGEHMLAIVGLRAIEQRRYLVRASTSGPSAVVDPHGRVRVRTQTGQPYVLRGAVKPERELTPYASLGDGFAAGCGFVVAAALLSRLFTLVRSGGGTDPARG